MGKIIQKKMVTMNDAHDPYEHDEYVLGYNIKYENYEIESNGRREQITPQNLVETMISFNERLMKDQEEHNQMNDAIL